MSQSGRTSAALACLVLSGLLLIGLISGDVQRWALATLGAADGPVAADSAAPMTSPLPEPSAPVTSVQPVPPTSSSLPVPAPVLVTRPMSSASTQRTDPPPSPTFNCELDPSPTRTGGGVDAETFERGVYAACKYMEETAVRRQLPLPLPELPLSPPVTQAPLPTTAPFAGTGSGHPVVCSDGWISQSGGRRGACSHHGGVG